MPLFATLVAACINGLTVFYGSVMAANQAMAWARRTFILALMTAFFVAVKVCVSSLLAQASTVGLPSKFLMGLGMFIPNNAAAVLACMGSVWLASVMVRLKIDGLRW